MCLTRRLPAAVVLGLAILVTAVPGLAQVGATTADLSGVVVDQLRAVVPGVAVRATNDATGLERNAVTGADGRYVIPALPPGIYSVTVAFAGFTSRRAENIRLALGEATVLDFELEIAARPEEVTVVAEPLLGAIRQGSVATVVSQREIESLPTNGRNFIAFSLITPGVNSDRTPQQGASASSGLTFVGQRGRSNNITVDGLDNNDFVAGGVRATFSQEAVQEFQVLASSYPAEFGNAAGGVVNIVTRSGTNTMSGNLFIFFRHDALNAKEYFERFTLAGIHRDRKALPAASVRRHPGGPLRRNQAFFFLAAERLRVRANNFVTIDDGAVDVLQRSGFPVDVGHVPYRYESDQVLAKVDTRVDAKHRLSLRFNWSDLLDENFESWGGQVARSRGAYLDGRDLVGAASLMSVCSSSRTINELRFQVAHRDQELISLDPTCSGVCDEIGEGGPAVDVESIKVGRPSFTPQPRENRRYQIVDTFSQDIGRHQLKLGGDVSWIHQPSLAWPFAFGGRYRFETRDAFALGRPSFYVQGYGNPSANDKGFSYLSLFAQDDWRFSDRLTLLLGVRYQTQGFPRITQIVPGLPSYGWSADNNNVAPRVGVSWKPSSHGEASFNGSYGIFYDHHPGVIWGAPFVLSGTADHTRSSRRSARPRWRRGMHRTGGCQNGNVSRSVTTIDPALKTPSAHHVSVGVERVFDGGSRQRRTRSMCVASTRSGSWRTTRSSTASGHSMSAAFPAPRGPCCSSPRGPTRGSAA
jgi:outer membrane receptor protein involved in Fe transport